MFLLNALTMKEGRIKANEKYSVKQKLKRGNRNLLRFIFLQLVSYLLNNVDTELVTNTESLTTGGKANIVFSNTLEAILLNNVCTSVHISAPKYQLGYEP